MGGKLAWRHNTRCIGKLYWRSLTVADRRGSTTPTEVRDACFEHLRWSANGGQARPLITVFTPDAPGAPAARVRNAQLVSYAGHRADDSSVLGDAANAELTDLARSCGWAPEALGRFDVLPLLIEEADGTVTAHDVPEELTYDVPIEHPTAPGIAGLDLRWYGFPTISDMALSIGGITYPLAPFTGWYVAPEISARDLTDPYRYDLLREIGEALGLDASDPLWRDRALVEMTAAVLHSYERAGVRIDDHHTATERFHRYTLCERRKGREVEAEWAWLVPPISGSATPVFHESYSSTQLWPNFFPEDLVIAWQRARERLVLTDPADRERTLTRVEALDWLRCAPEAFDVAALPPVAEDRYDFHDVVNLGLAAGLGTSIAELAQRALLRYAASPPRPGWRRAPGP